VFAIGAVGGQMVLGFALALLCSRVSRGRVLYRAMFILPILVPGIVIGAIWKLMLNFDFGLVNQITELVGMEPRNWLGDKETALASVIVVDIWHWTPFCFLLLLAGLESLPQDPYEAAKIDGATWWQELRFITLPLMAPAILVTFAFRLVIAFKVFDEIYLLTGGGPVTATEVLSFTLYQRFFTEDRAGYGSAMAIAIIFFCSFASGRRTLGAPPLGVGGMRRLANRLLPHATLMAIAAAILVPVIWVIAAGFRTQISLLTGEFLFTPVLSNFVEVLFSKTSDFLVNYRNSMIVGSASTVLCLTIATLAAWSLARLAWPRWVVHVFLGWALLFQMLPPVALASAWYTMARVAGLENTFTGLILAHTVLNLPMALWLMGVFVREVPIELEEAARIDGASTAVLLRHVVLPLVAPGLAACAILTFVSSWNEFAVAHSTSP
jgi:ABC-type sugar transport system permease subunit